MNDCKSIGTVSTVEVFRCCIQYATEYEMAVRLEDVIYRRTDLAPRGLITSELLQVAADEMSRQLEWNADMTSEQITAGKSRLRYAVN